MPVDFEMILSASPPVFSPFADFRYGACRSSKPGQMHPMFLKQHKPLNGYVQAAGLSPIRPCLIIKEDLDRTCDAEDPISSPTKEKKRVWFADDRGLSLTHVRVMNEPSDCPPRWTDEFLEQVTRGIKPNPSSDHRWEVTFPQPASDYLAFRHKLEKNFVSLENVIVREPDDLLTGTIKVKNVSFEKEVNVRATFDRWSTFQDFPASFVPSGLDAGGTSLFDTFSFSLSIPASCLKFGRVEFCVQYKCQHTEHWDNNADRNYKIVCYMPKEGKEKVHLFTPRFADAVTAHFESWTEFASWNHLINDGPYW